VRPDRALGAGAADEALDLAVGVHERRVTGVRARRVHRAHHHRRDERHACAHQLLGARREALRDGH
jgi:hypothetical protein